MGGKGPGIAKICVCRSRNVSHSAFTSVSRHDSKLAHLEMRVS